MKRIYTVALMMMLGGLAARAALFNQTFNVNTAIPDGNPTGVTFGGAFNAAGVSDTVLSLTVGLNITGGYNGDLYAYLVAPDQSTMVVLMNEPGVSVNGLGAGGSGMNITLQDGATPNIQSVTANTVLSGTYGADGTLGNFSAQTANGTWTLFMADLSSGGGTSTLNSWTLNITTVPEPSEGVLALCMVGVLVGLKTFKTKQHTSLH